MSDELDEGAKGDGRFQTIFACAPECIKRIGPDGGLILAASTGDRPLFLANSTHRRNSALRARGLPSDQIASRATLGPHPLRFRSRA